MAVTVITKDNFLNLLPPILHHINEADFIAFDTELTGLTSGSNNKYFYYDEIEERYAKLRDSAISFGVLQFGLSAWKYKAASNGGGGGKYVSTSWSFHLFPSTGGGTPGNSNDYRKWTLQLSSILFLKEHGFDFNKTFLEGISYLSKKEEVDVRARQEIGKKNDNNKQLGRLSEDDQKFIALTIVEVQNWFDKGHEEALELAPCNSFQRLLLYQNLPKASFGEHLTISKKNTGGLILKITTAEERANAEEDAKIEFEKQVMEMIGFRRIIDHIIKLGKPLVGHNCFLDVCHTFQKFIAPLPMDWEEFRQEWSRFGPVCDTKFISSQIKIQGKLPNLETGNSLEQLAVAIDDLSIWGVKVKVDGGKTKNAKSFHDAGFDAFCTGKVFIGLATILSKESGREVNEEISDMFKVDKFGNQLFMMRSDYERYGVPLATGMIGKDTPDRSNLVVLTDLNSSIGINNINDALHSKGLQRGQFEQCWQDGRTVYISFKEESFHLDSCCSLLINVDGRSFTVRLMPYEEWRRLQAETPSKRQRIN